MSKKSVNYTRESLFARISIAITLLCLLGAAHFIGVRMFDAYQHHKTSIVLEDIAFALAIGYMIYSALLYEICVMGYYEGQKKHTPATRDALQQLYLKTSPTLSILIPSYKEEYTVNWQTMMSAALSEYPHKNVVLLLDDPYRTNSQTDLMKLEESRQIAFRLQKKFDEPMHRFSEEYDAYLSRKAQGNMRASIELNRLSLLYDEAAEWLEDAVRDMAAGRTFDSMPHTDRFFVKSVFNAPIAEYKRLAKELRRKMTVGNTTTDIFLESHYGRLKGLFNVTFSSFERKKYVNLSHQANKAMNLNSYIALIGKSWKEVETKRGLELHETTIADADFTIPASDYVNTIDADSLMMPDYVIRMIELMQRPENHRLAVVQSSVSSIPDSPNLLEKAAGISLDLQFMNHQGFTHWNATFWVGANAMLRHTALEEICERKEEDGNMVSIYIQDRTVIEDTESSIDLIDKGWQLYNYPERMSYSAMPGDFGSLLIQRRRWANGGMIILPKLLRYTMRAPKTLMLLKEFFMRFNYLAGTTLSCVVIALLSICRFGDDLETLWIMIAVIPSSLLYVRTLIVSGYKIMDMFRIFSINLMLMPVLFGGVGKQFQQMVTGKKIPFGRTPKVTGRTAAPMLYCIIELVMTLGFLYVFSHDIAAHRWYHAIFTAFNSACMIYAVTYFIGLSEALEDISAGFLMYGNLLKGRSMALANFTAQKARALALLIPFFINS